MSRHQNKQDNSQSKKIDLLTPVWFRKMKLGRHVIESTELRQKYAWAVFALKWWQEPEVSDLDVEIVVQEQILWLQVSMGYSRSVAEVETLQHLFENVAGQIFFESASDGKIIEQFSTCGELKNDELHFLLFAIVFLIYLWPKFDLLYKILMLDGPHCFNFIYD